MIRQQHRSVSPISNAVKIQHGSQQNDYQLNPPAVRQLDELPLQQSQSDDEDILWEIDSLLLQNQAQSISINSKNNNNGQQVNCRGTQRQMLLSFKIAQLQKIINNLNVANKKLKTQLQEYYLNEQHHQQEVKQYHVNGQTQIKSDNQNKSNNYNNVNTQNNANKQNNTNKQNNANTQPNGNNYNKPNSDSSSNNSKNSSLSQAPFCDQLTQMHGEFQQIQHLISQYKQQLNTAENKWNTLKQQKDQEIDSLKIELIRVTDEKELIQQQIDSLLKQNQLLRHKNQQLLIDVDSLQMELERRQQQIELQRRQHQYQQHHHYQPHQQQSHINYLPQPQPLIPANQPRYYQPTRKQQQHFQDYHFNEKIKRQMQTMINELFKKLQNQKKINSTMKKQIKRLNNQVIQLQRTIKVKNDMIYQLQMRTIQMEKNLNTQKGGYSNINTNINTTRSNLSRTRNTPRMMMQSHDKLQYNNQQQFKLQLNLKPKNQQMWLQDQYQSHQYTDRTDRTGNNYGNEDNVVTPLLIKNTRSPPKLKHNQQGSYNITNSNQALLNNNNNNQALPINYNFIKPKRIAQQLSSKMSKIKNNSDNNQQSQHANQHNNNMANKQFTCFSLMQLQSGKIKITMKQKILIISRVIELYCKKIKGKCYQNLIAEDIQIYNFNNKFPNLVRVRVANNTKTDTTTGVANEDTGEQKLMYNLAFIVQTIVKEVNTIDRQDLQVDLNLTDVIEEILNKNMQDKIAYFQQLSKSLQTSALTLVG